MFQCFQLSALLPLFSPIFFLLSCSVMKYPSTLSAKGLLARLQVRFLFYNSLSSVCIYIYTFVDQFTLQDQKILIIKLSSMSLNLHVLHTTQQNTFSFFIYLFIIKKDQLTITTKILHLYVILEGPGDIETVKVQVFWYVL